MTKVKYSFAQWCRDNGHEDWLNLWDYELNNVGPEDVAYGSHKKFYFKCPRELHESEEKTIRSLTNGDMLFWCHACNSIGQFLIDTFGENAINEYWSDKNEVDPFKISKRSNTKIWMKCNVRMHNDSYIMAKTISDGNFCLECSRDKVVQGVNDVKTLRPDLLKYFKYPEDAEHVTLFSNRIIELKCPDCGTDRKMSMYKLTTNGFNCKICGDGNSYPNKFVREFLLQLSCKYNFHIEPEYVPAWAEHIHKNIRRRIYDFALFYNTGEMIIIEVHGEQHYKNGFGNINGARNVQEEQSNDIMKYNLAIQNGVLPENYIVIDARYSSCEWIKASLLNSNLDVLFPFTDIDIDWDRCNEMACSNMVKIVCDAYMNGMKKNLDLCNQFGYCKKTIHKYLKIGASLGWCNYSEKNRYHIVMKPLRCVDNGYVFASRAICSQVSADIFGKHLTSTGISGTIHKEQSHTGGFHFVEITKEEFMLAKRNNPSIAFGDI